MAQRTGKRNILITALLVMLLIFTASSLTFAEDAGTSGTDPPRTVEVSVCEKTDSTKPVWHYCKYFKVRTESGKTVIPTYYQYDCDREVASPGLYDVTVTFSGKYSGCEPLYFTLKVIPPRTHIYADPGRNGLRSIDLTVNTDKGEADHVTAEISTRKDFRNALVLKAKPKATEYYYDAADLKFKNLRKNTVYYIRARASKVTKEGTYYSEYTYAETRTLKKMPKYSVKQKDVKKILSRMKKNKSFVYTFGGFYDLDSAFSFIESMEGDYPQYVGRYEISGCFSDRGTQIYFDPGPGMKKCIKATKVINRIAKKANKKHSVRAKVRYINSYLCGTCKYDYATKNRTSKYNPDAYTVYGCLIRGRAVCEGYAKSFNAIAVRCGIKTKFVRNKNHVWNKVKAGGRWLNVDVTWNDCQKHNKTKYLLRRKHRLEKR